MNRRMIGTGPYQFVERVLGSHVLHERVSYETIYSYDIDTAQHMVRVIGNDDDSQNLWPVKPENYVWSRTNVNFCENDGTGVTEVMRL